MSTDFDFDEWRRLYKKDPKGAERRRKKETDAIISAAPEKERERLRGLQWRINMVRKRHKDSPLGSAIAIYMLSQMKLDELNEVFHTCGLGSYPRESDHHPQTAKILAFPKK